MDILFEKLLAQLLFWIYDFIDTISMIFNILAGTQAVNDDKQTLLEVFVESAVPTKVLLGLCVVSIVIAGACVGVKVVKNIVRIKAGGEATSHAVTVKQGGLAILSSVACIFFVFMFIAFSSMLLNMVNSTLTNTTTPTTISQNLFDLSVEQCYVLEDEPSYRYNLYTDDYGNYVQETDPTSEDGLLWEKNNDGTYLFDDDGQKIPVYKQVKEEYYAYKTDENGNLISTDGWLNGKSASDITWNMSPDEVFGVHRKDWLGLFEKSDQDYTTPAMVDLSSFNFLTAYLVAIIMLISLFMISIGLVKRIYDIMILLFSMPLVCGTIPLDDGARFRAWRETMMSKVLIVFGAVIGINVFFYFAQFITTGFNLTYLIEGGYLSTTAVSIFKMVLLLGGAVCINGSQTLVSRILGTSADESREAMQAFNLVTSGVRLGGAGLLGAGRMAGGAKRLAFGGTNRFGRSSVGAIPRMFRTGNSLGDRIGGEKYNNSRGAAFVRKLGKMGGSPYGKSGSGGTSAGGLGGGGKGRSSSILQPQARANPMKALSNADSNVAKLAQSVSNNVGNLASGSQTDDNKNSVRPSSDLRVGERKKASAFKNKTKGSK